MASAATASVPDDALPPARHRDRPGINTADWAQAASAFQATGGDESRAHSLLYQLDARGLRKLAVDAAAWPRGGRTLRALRAIYHRWAEVDPLAAFAQARSLDPDTQDSAYFEAMRGFVGTQPQQAAAYFAAPPAADAVSRLRNLADRRLMLGLAVAAWSEQDGQAAVDFIGQLPADTLYPGPAGSLGAEYARQDPAAALSWALRQTDQSVRSSALDGVIGTWAEADPLSAANDVLSLSGDFNQGKLVDALVSQWATQDLPGAARWAAGQGGAVQIRAAASVASQWSRNDPAAAAAWASELPGDARDTAYAAIAGNWYALDPGAAKDWLDHLPSGNAFDSAVGDYLEDYRNDDPPTERIAWAGKISDSQKRNGAIVKILNGWLSNAPQAAQQWISQANLPGSITGKLSGG